MGARPTKSAIADAVLCRRSAAAGVVSASASASMAALPLEVVEKLLRFFVGVELLALAQVNAFLRHLIQADPRTSDWGRRLGSAASKRLLASLSGRQQRAAVRSPVRAKMLYCRARSLLFPGQPRTMTPSKHKQQLQLQPHQLQQQQLQQNKRGPSVKLPRNVITFAKCKSFELWFSLLPGSATAAPGGTYVGGVLLGLQSTPTLRATWPYYDHDWHYAFVHVDAERNLYCSLAASKPVVARALECNRWYHLALEYDGVRQRVYLDGKPAHVQYELAYRNWLWLEHAQLGTGFLGGDDAGKPTAGFRGWYGFHGLVDAFRTWNTQLTRAEIEQLARGESIERKPLYALTQDVAAVFGGRRVERVRCSRPLEGAAFVQP